MSSNTSGSSSPTHMGMQRQGTHLYSLPSGRRYHHQHNTSTSTTGSSINSRWSNSPEAPSMPLTSSSRSSLAESSSHGGTMTKSTTGGAADSTTQEWSLLSIVRVRGSTGMVLVALYHISTSTLYTWPLQTDPKAPQPKQGTVFVAPMQEDEASQNDKVMSESLQMLSKVLLTWMRQGAASSRPKSKAKLGEKEEDTDWLRRMLKMPKMDDNLTRAILDKQVVRPVQEWSRGHERGTSSDSSTASSSIKGKSAATPIPTSNSKGKGVLGTLNTNVQSRQHTTDSARSSAGNYLSPSSGVPSIEVSSPNTSEIRGRADVPWLQTKTPHFVR